MTTIVEAAAKLRPDETFFSYEVFPAKTKTGMQNLEARLERMVKLGPLFVTITWGAGGSTAQKSLDLATLCYKQLQIPTCLHLTCTNMDKEILDSTLEKAKESGIRNILALRGDPPRGEEYWTPNSTEFSHAVDLVRYIKANHGDYFCIGVAGYPEGHVDGADASDQCPEKDLPYLVEKIEAGAQFIITQMFYDVDKFMKYEQLLRSNPVLRDVLVIPGLMPINTYQSFLRAAKLSHASIPQNVLDRLDNVPTTNDEEVKQLGVDVILGLISGVHEKAQGRIRGFHFYTLNLERSVALILEKSNILQIASSAAAVSGRPIDAPDKDISAVSLANHTVSSMPDVPTIITTPLQDSAIASDDEDAIPPPTGARKQRKSSVNAHNKAIFGEAETLDSIPPSEAGITAVDIPTDTVLAISTGEGALGREANWDDFPNGRFGDSRSPAYGEIDGYGPSLHVDNAKAYKIWGYPVEPKDITELFLSHITNKLEALPWSDQALNPETALIQEELYELNSKGFWTVASQPAGNAVKSEDNIFGWGPRGGKVFQKSFVEFFAPKQDWLDLKLRLDHLGSEVSYYAGNSSGNFITNMPPGSSNAVTWGVFPNREILQSTIIEEESFLAWRDEAFGVWKEWQRLYHKQSASYKLLDHIYNNYYLVTVVHHNYFDQDALWTFLRS